MKKFLTIAILSMSLISWVGFSFGAVVKRGGINYEVLEGPIQSIKLEKKLLVFQDTESNRERTVHIDPATLASLKPGDKISVTLQGSNCIAQRVDK